MNQWRDILERRTRVHNKLCRMWHSRCFFELHFFFLSDVTAFSENHTGTFPPYILTAAYNPSLQRAALKMALKGDIISFPFLSQKEQLRIGRGGKKCI